MPENILQASIFASVKQLRECEGYIVDFCFLIYHPAFSLSLLRSKDTASSHSAMSGAEVVPTPRNMNLALQIRMANGDPRVERCRML